MHSPEMSLGEMFDTAVAVRALEKSEQKLEKYLRAPYRFDLPPTEKKLMHGDPEYGHYMCRSNLWQEPFVVVNDLIQSREIPWTNEERAALQRFFHAIETITHAPGNRTPEDMAALRNGLTIAVSTIENKLAELQAEKLRPAA
jgi:hypothetical protein